MFSIKSFVSNASKVVSIKAGRAGLKAKKYAPEIWMGLGIVSFGATIILAGKAAIEAKDILKEHKENMDVIAKCQDVMEEDGTPEKYDDEKAKKERLVAYSKTTVGLAKTYAPVAAVAVLSLTCILTSRNILHSRYTGAVAAYDAISGTFKLYRQRVKDEYGDLMDRHFMYGTELTKEAVLDESGKKTKEKQDVEIIDVSKIPSDYAMWFDESNSNWDPDPMFNKLFLRSQQNMANDLFNARGHLFLNEVYGALGLPHTQAGSVCGWLKINGDEFVDFGIFDSGDNSARRFVNGDDNRFLLNFNHMGIIYDKI